VVRHQTPRQDAPAQIARDPGEDPKEPLAVGVVEEDRLPAVATSDDVTKAC